MHLKREAGMSGCTCVGLKIARSVGTDELEVWGNSDMVTVGGWFVADASGGGEKQVQGQASGAEWAE